MIAPWLAIGLGGTTFVVCLVQHVRKRKHEDASTLALLAGCVIVLILQSLEIV